IDDTTILKKGRHSVGVAPQYCSTLGKIANCQTLVSLTLARGEVPVMLSLRLFLPESWTLDRSRLKRAGVPVEYRKPRTKAEIDRVIAAGVRFGCVLADAGYGPNIQFRNGLTARKLTWAVGIPCQIRVYAADVKMIWPVARRGPPRQYSVPETAAVAAEDMLAQATWQTPSVGALAPKKNSRRASAPFASGSLMDQGGGSEARPGSVYRERKFGSSASTALRGRRNTILPTYRRKPTCALWQKPSRGVGSASRHISS